MNEESSLRRFKAGSPGKQSHSENSAKELAYAKNNYNSPEFDRETGNHIENMKNGGNNILVSPKLLSVLISNFDSRWLFACDR